MKPPSLNPSLGWLSFCMSSIHFWFWVARLHLCFYQPELLCVILVLILPLMLDLICLNFLPK